MINYLSHADELIRACKRLNSSNTITVDTEFIAGPLSYFPKLCLIQIFDGEEVYLIDTLNSQMDLSPIFEIFENNKIRKVFHSSFVDIQILKLCYNVNIRNIFDTQIAYMFLHNEQMISYGKFIEKYLDVHLDKSLQVSGWDKRPLTDAQKNYAAADVTYLYKTVDIIENQLKNSNKYEWFLEEMQSLEDTEFYKTNNETVFRKIKINSSAPIVLLKLKELAKLREEYAQENNIFPQNIIADSVLIKIAFGRDIDNILQQKINDNDLRKKIFNTLRDINKLSPSEIKARLGKVPDINSAKIAKKIKNAIKAVAQKHQISESLIYQNRDITDLSLHLDKKDLNIFKGWRAQLLKDTIQKTIEKIKSGS